VLVLKPGVEICAPVWVATALLCTCQPPAPRFEISLAPVPEAGLGWTAAVVIAAALAAEAAANGVACALDASQSSVVAETAAAPQRAEGWRKVPVIAGNSCPAAAVGRERRRSR
jgi:hypothetical protein